MPNTNTHTSTSQSILKRLAAGLVGLMLAATATPLFGQHVHQLLYIDNWADTDLTALTGGPTANSQNGSTSFFTQTDQLHVYYASASDQHVHQLYNNGTSWSDSDLTSETNGQTIGFDSPLSGFQIAGAQYVYFCGSDSVVHEYTYGNNGDFSWVDSALPTGGTKGQCSDAPSISAIFTSPNNQRHVYYTAESSSSATAPLHQLYFNGSSWANQPFSGKLLKGAKPVEQGGGLVAIAINNEQYVFFQSGNAVYMYSYVDNWSISNISGSAKAPLPGSEFNGVAAFNIPGTSNFEVYYAATKTNHLIQLSFANNTWTEEDLTEQAGGSGPEPDAQMTALSTPGNSHLYLDEGGDIFQLYFNGSDWTNEQLPSTAAEADQLSSFAIGNDQYVYYISN
jgi:hypothetical protein